MKGMTMKITLSFDEKTTRHMEELSKMTGQSHLENIQHGLAILQLVTEMERAGTRITAIDRNGIQEELTLRPIRSVSPQP